MTKTKTPVKEMACKIIEVGKLVKLPDSDIQQITIRKLDNAEVLQVGVFLNGGEFTFQSGDEIIMGLRIGTYKSKKDGKERTSYSASLNSLIPTGTNMPNVDVDEFPPKTIGEAFISEMKGHTLVSKEELNPEPKPTVPQNVWDEKEERNYSGKSIMYALETIKMSKDGEYLKTLETSAIRNLIEMEAEQWYQWIWKKKNNEKV